MAGEFPTTTPEQNEPEEKDIDVIVGEDSDDSNETGDEKVSDDTNQDESKTTDSDETGNEKTPDIKDNVGDLVPPDTKTRETAEEKRERCIMPDGTIEYFTPEEYHEALMDYFDRIGN